MKTCKKVKIRKFLSRISTIHGLSYIADRRSSRISRIFWISALILSFLGCFFYFLQVYDKVFVAPDILIKFSYKPYRNFPFPAITICPENKFPRTILNFKENMEILKESGNITDDERINMELAFQACPYADYNTIDTSVNLSNINLVELLLKEQFKNDEIMTGLCWNTCFHYTNWYFKRVLTIDGFCMTFNLLDSSELFTADIHNDFKYYTHGSLTNWEPDKKYPKNYDFYPYRIPSGYYNELRTYLINSTNFIDPDCSYASRGYRVFIHPSNEILTTWHEPIEINNVNKSNTIELKVMSFKASSELRGYGIKHRKCYYKDEKQLKFFKIYNENNCKFECLANKTFERCGCVRYFMPRNNLTRLCGSKELNCCRKLLEEFEDFLDDDGCECYPACDRIKYVINQKEVTDLYPEQIEEIFEGFYYENGSRPQITELYIDVLKEEVEERMSFAPYQMQQFISDFGGLLSLAMGCSILSIVELIYNALCVRNENESESENDDDVVDIKVE